MNRNLAYGHYGFELFVWASCISHRASGDRSLGLHRDPEILKKEASYREPFSPLPERRVDGDSR